eukprot:TRINITY_DN4009_c0_g1_i2.p1 TRINITY_DN4009_c0_g1~~TRINITY_DN4009_c0_g1_i2.p1  ORF type:complete len:293 (-),score=85.50 TRINITY_DN4009_c0_g1_i2:61-939(-)
MAPITKWADVDEDDEEGPADAQAGNKGTRFESGVDKDGVKTVIEYLERNGQTFKVTKKVKVTTVSRRTNNAILERKEMKKFGKAATIDERAAESMCVKSVEAVGIDLTKKVGGTAQMATKDDAEEKFYEESIALTETLFKEKKAWSEMNREKKDDVAPAAEDKPADSATPAEAPAPGQPGRYVPPSLRGKGADAGKGGKGDGKGGFDPSQEASLRITNLSEDVREGDLQDLFAQCGRLQRVYLAKDPVTFQSRGFAFVTYYTREDAQKAIDKLNGHGYDNLILQVQFAKPRT